MKHYLKLVPISAKIHHKQSKMTRICITLAVLLVAVMFGLADMYLQGMILSRLVDTFSSRILYPMLLLSGNHSIAVV